MTLLFSILAFIVIFSVLILIHEWGHFYTARKCGVKVEEFGFGMPPKIWKYKPKNSDTTYTINAIPFGGFVKLYGEDSSDKKLLKAKSSFSGKPIWQKSLIVLAGILMNLVLAFVLLYVGLVVGMKPLLLNSQDAFQAIDNGTLEIKEGIIVKAPGLYDLGFQDGDKLLSLNGQPIVLGDEIDQLGDKAKFVLTIERDDKKMDFHGINRKNEGFAEFYETLFLPRLIVADVDDQNDQGFVNGEEIKSVQGKNIYQFDDLEKILLPVESKIAHKFEHNWELYPLIISEVLSSSNASRYGLKVGDQLLSVNHKKVHNTGDLYDAMQLIGDDGKVIYEVQRGSTIIEYFIPVNSDGMIGVLISEVKKVSGRDLYVYSVTKPYSVLKVNDVSYGPLVAVKEAVMEIGKLSVLTIEMFGNVLASIFTKFTIPEGVAGPVGIAQMTFVFVQEGFMSLLRFTALLSLSLAIINLLPFPGLDGGRFFLMIIPMLIGKKINPKFEAIIHFIGFILLMLMIVMVTFNDILRLFS